MGITANVLKEGLQGNINESVISTICEKKPYSERIGMLKERTMTRQYETDIERAKYVTRSYKKSEGQPACMRAAKALEETLRNMTIRIEEGELLVGSKTAKKWGGPIYIEASPDNMYTLLSTRLYKKAKIKDIFPNGIGGQSAKFLEEVPNISEEEYNELTEQIMPFWKENSIERHKIELWKAKGVNPPAVNITSTKYEVNAFGGKAPDTTQLITDGQGHVTVGIKKVLDRGFKGIARQAAEQLAKLMKNEKNYERRKDFLESVQVTSSAACEFAERYAKLAEEMATKETDGQRKIELLKIAERCHRVPAEPPRNLMEALQSIWLTQAMVVISYGDASITAPGRIDQYVYPYYQEDIKKGGITREQALEAIEEYYIKLATCHFFGPNNVTIGGVDKKGEDATNEVSYLFLEANKNLMGLRNGLAVRISSKTPRDFLTAACESYRTTAGVVLYNDEVIIKGLLEDGYSLEDARDYGIVGCVEPTGTGNNNGYTGSNGIFPVTILEAALNGGCRSIVGWERMGIATPPPSELKSFEDVKKAFRDQMAHAIDMVAKRSQLKDEVIAEKFPLPLLSSTIEGCVESGEDVTRGGAKYNHGCITSQGLATCANSLAAIKWAVFDEELLTMEELAGHLKNNFEGAEDLRRQLMNAPKYGNDDPYVDEIAFWVADMYNSEVKRHKFWLGGYQRACLISALSQDVEGLLCGATPDGRLSGQVVSNGMSPANGTDISGMTAVLRSGAMVSAVQISDGTAINITMNPMTIKNDENLDKFVSMIEAYFALGGRQIQFNPISKAALKDAQLHPENYPELNIKVSGFSMRFIDIPKSLQDDIIARTEFTTM